MPDVETGGTPAQAAQGPEGTPVRVQETELAFRADRFALETRLLLHDALPQALNPDHLFTQEDRITNEQLGTPETRTFTVFNAASTTESHVYWTGQTEQTHDARYNTWRSKWVRLIG